jgi:hypothetical protein
VLDNSRNTDDGERERGPKASRVVLGFLFVWALLGVPAAATRGCGRANVGPIQVNERGRRCSPAPARVNSSLVGHSVHLAPLLEPFPAVDRGFVSIGIGLAGPTHP